MNSLNQKKNLLKRFLTTRWYWSLLGPIYNDLVAKSSLELYQRIAQEISPPTEVKILDVGSGPGLFTIKLAQENPSISIVGVDHSPTQVRAANRLLAKTHLENCSFKVGNAMNLPFENASFDIVVSLASIKHWPDEKRGLQEIQRVLKPGALAFISEVDKEAKNEEIYKYADRFKAWYSWNRFLRWYLIHVVFRQSYTLKEVESVAQEVGFRIISSKKISGWPFFLIKLEK
jgi:ubiquinone/menaquinone biosynthesis C-methylase UbiE